MSKETLWKTGAGDGLPDGATVESYAGWEKWTGRRWAWEFLRRNPHFILDCKKVASCDQKPEAVALKYHLRVFKSFSKKFNTKKSPAPVFPLNSYRFAANVTGEGLIAKKQVLVPLKPGEAIYVFDFNPEIQIKGSLQAQIDLATKLLNERQKIYLESLNLKPAKNTKPQSGTFIKAIQLLDATRESESIAIGFKSAFPTMCRNLTQNEIRRQAESLLRPAREYTLSGYLQIAAGKGAKIKAKATRQA